MRLYMVFDRLAEEGGGVFEQPTDAAAARMFKKFLANAPGERDEYWLFRVGSFDTRTMEITREGPSRVEIGAEKPAAVGGNEDGKRDS